MFQVELFGEGFFFGGAGGFGFGSAVKIDFTGWFGGLDRCG